MEKYYIGFDIGTESVGWAVTDETYHVKKKNGKALWGVRLFDEAQTAAERRRFRTARRRYERRHQRLEWLRQMFSDEIAQVDPGFFQRMDESKFLLEDKALTHDMIPLGRYTLFADPDFCDRDYHQKYPTIYHLRKALMVENHSFDIRLVYLALHHLLKNRGHFLFGDMSLDDVSFESCYDTLKNCLADEYELDFELPSPIEFKQLLTNHQLTVTNKQKALHECSGYEEKRSQLSAVIDLLAGASVKPSALFAREYSKEDDKSFSFNGDFDSKEAELTDLLNDDMQLVHHIKRLYDWSLLDELRDGEALLSFAKVKIYEQHHADLAKLKALLRPHKSAYREMFRLAKNDLNNYPAYSGHGAANHRCTYKQFCSYTQKLLQTLEGKQSEEAARQTAEVLARLTDGSFLTRQTNQNNGVIPHQLHEQELKIILERASAYLPFLNNVDDSGLTLSQRIVEMFRFHIPYYVGPLNVNSQYSWITRSNDKITPWNFEKVVDLEQSAEKFITRMTATCRYIGEPVLPKDSLLYSRFIALNTINKICINGHPISVETKQRIFKEHLLPQGKATWYSVKNYLLANGLMQKGDELSGIDKEMKLSLTGYKVFEKLLSEGCSFRTVEDIIKHLLLFGEDRKVLERWLHKTYGKILKKEDCEHILRNRNRFHNWGNLSAEFLTEIKHVDSEGERISIIDMLWQTNDNLMELLSSRYTFAEAVEAYRAQKYGSQNRTLDQLLTENYASPGIRRAIHQAIGIVSEIEKIMKAEPTRVFVEVTRSEETEKRRTVSRKRQLDELYAHCKDIAPQVYEQLQGYDETALRSTKLYLYFTQLGKCMYSGESIDLSRLAIDYDIDHIHPQKLVKDDSITNRVLVKKELNAQKSDGYPLAENIRSAMRSHWNLLKAKGLISDEKYRRLTRNTPFTDDELSGFIARQLVETSQACKIVAELLRNRYNGQDKVVYVKAKNVSSFRQDQRILPDGTQAQAWACKGVETRQDPLFVKCREVNDFHHAKDAYLNIVVGNVYYTKFTSNPMNFVRSKQEKYSLNRMFDFDVVRNGECAWKAGPEGSMDVVRKAMRKNNILFTRYAHEAKGGLFDQLIVPKGMGQAMIKSSDARMTTKKYGGYNKLKGAYFCLVEHTEKKRRVRSIEAVMMIHKALYEKDPVLYCEKILGLHEPEVMIRKIMINALVSYDGFRMNISGRTGNRLVFKNANQLVVSPEEATYIKQISKYITRYKSAHTNLPVTRFDGISVEKNIDLYALLSSKLHTKPYDVKYATAAKTIDGYAAAFQKQTLHEQCQILLQILNLFNTTAASANLKLLCGTASVGLLRSEKKINMDDPRRFVLIHQSITGFFEKEIDLQGDSL